jgi:hypothetical protein
MSFRAVFVIFLTAFHYGIFILGISNMDGFYMSKILQFFFADLMRIDWMWTRVRLGT